MKRSQYMWIDLARSMGKYTSLTYVHLDDAMKFVDRCHWYYPDIELPILGMLEEFEDFIRVNCRCKYCKKPVPKNLGACDCGRQKKLIKVEFLAEIFVPIFEDVLRLQSWTDWTERKAFRRKKRLVDAGGKYSKADVIMLFNLQNGSCYYCLSSLVDLNNKERFHIDHYISVANGGTNGLENLVLACPICNIKKGSENGDSFARKTTKTLPHEDQFEVRKIRKKISKFISNNKPRDIQHN